MIRGGKRLGVGRKRVNHRTVADLSSFQEALCQTATAFNPTLRLKKIRCWGQVNVDY